MSQGVFCSAVWNSLSKAGEASRAALTGRVCSLHTDVRQDLIVLHQRIEVG